MSDLIYPRSMRETMCGWSHLPRYIDKIRLFLAGKLGEEYRPYLGKNSDGIWLAAAGVTHEQMVEVVRNTITDGEVCDWVRLNIRKTDAEKEAHRKAFLEFPSPTDPEAVAYFEKRKTEYGLAHRTEIKVRPDMVDADEGRI